MSKLIKILLMSYMAIGFALSGNLYATELQQQVLFQQGDLGYNTFRIPAIVCTNNGTLLAFAEGRVYDSGDDGNIDILVRRSTDNGITWSTAQVVYNDGDNTIGNPAPVVDLITGTVFLSFCRNNDEVFITSSTNNGQSWSTPVNITSMVKLGNWTWYATGPCHGIQLIRGVHAGRLIIPCDHNSGVRGAHVIYSDDHGATWHVGGIVTTQGDMWPNECVAVELTDGSVYLNIRNQNDSVHQRIVAYSNDSGESFGTPLYDEELIDPKVQGSALRFSAVDQGDSENRVIFSNPASESSRILMMVRSSFDETQSWEGKKLIYLGPSAYSDLVKLADGSIGLLYENGSDWAYRRITFAKFTADWLDATTYVAWEFNEKLPGNTASIAIKDSDGYGLHAQAEAAFEYVSGDPQQGATSALRFTGSGYGVRLTDAKSGGWLDFGSDGSFMIEALIRTTAHGSGGATGSGAIVAKDVGTNQPSWWLRVQDSKLVFLICDGTTTSSVSSSGAINDGLWHRVAAVRDANANELSVYVDGVLAGTLTGAADGSLANGNDVVVGRFNEEGRSFIGDIDYVRISYRPRCLIGKFDGDLNGDCIVNIGDLIILTTNWLKSGFE